MADQSAESSVEATLRAQARTQIYERLAFLSALIWMGGTALLFVFYVPFIENPYKYFTIAVLLPLIPAAAPWLLYGYLAERRARKLIARHAPRHP